MKLCLTSANTQLSIGSWNIPISVDKKQSINAKIYRELEYLILINTALLKNTWPKSRKMFYFMENKIKHRKTLSTTNFSNCYFIYFYIFLSFFQLGKKKKIVFGETNPYVSWQDVVLPLKFAINIFLVDEQNKYESKFNR